MTIQENSGDTVICDDTASICSYDSKKSGRVSTPSRVLSMKQASKVIILWLWKVVK